MSDNKQTQEYKRDGNTAYVLYAPYPDKPDHLTNKIWAKFNADVRCDIKIAHEAAELFVEAANVKAESGKGPKELAKSNSDLLEHIEIVQNEHRAHVQKHALLAELYEQKKEENKALAERVKELEQGNEKLTKFAEWMKTAYALSPHIVAQANEALNN